MSWLNGSTLFNRFTSSNAGFAYTFPTTEEYIQLVCHGKEAYRSIHNSRKIEGMVRSSRSSMGHQFFIIKNGKPRSLSLIAADNTGRVFVG